MPARHALHNSPRRRPIHLRLFRFAPHLLALGLAVTVAASLTAIADDVPQRDDTRELARARREVKLLDDIYKTAIVLITEHYVEEDSDLAAGEAFKALFAGMKEKGWHEVRLLDATGDPLSAENAPRDDFEKQAVKALLAGKPYYEAQVDIDGKRFLRAATPVPIVMEKCKMCHANYADQKVVGALGYTLPLDTTSSTTPSPQAD